MSRKIHYTDQYPYHITARVNNKEWFVPDINLVWAIFQEALIRVHKDYHLQIHSFILMNNHYHLIATVDKKYPLNVVMQWFQYYITLRLNYYADAENHVFGGRYRASVITRPLYYYHATRYLYRNAVASGIVWRPEIYPYSTLVTSKIPITPPRCGIDELVPKERSGMLSWLNSAYSSPEAQVIARAMKKPKFRFPQRMTKKLQKNLCHP
jgi:putative transposase